MNICLLMLDIICTVASPQGSIFTDGFDMYLSYDRPSNFAWTLDSIHHNATALTSIDALSDGKVSIPFRVTWDAGTPAITDYVIVQSFFTGSAISDNSNLVFAVLFPKTQTAPPVGTKIFFQLTNDVVTTSIFGRTVAFNNGATGVVLVVPQATGYTPNNLIYSIYNDVAGATWATSGQTVDIAGELWFGTLVEFKNTPDPQYSLIDPTTNRRSHNNTPRPLFGKPYRQAVAALTPLSDAQAYSATNNFDKVRYQLSQTEAMMLLPRIYQRGTTTQDTDAINQLAIFGRPDNIGALTGVRDAAGLWTVPSITISEAPP